MEYAYARVSAKDQNLTRQVEAFLERGIAEERIFCDKRSGKDFEREAYGRLMGILKPGDLVVVKSIDRLGRNYGAILAEWSRITNGIGADILVLDMPLLDTRAQAGSLIGKFISDLVLQVLSFAAENERENIRLRQREGIALAKARGVHMGRPVRQLPARFYEAAERYAERSVPLKDAVRMAGMTKQNFYYHLSRVKAGAQNGFASRKIDPS